MCRWELFTPSLPPREASAADRTTGRRPYPEATGDGQSSGVSISQRNPGHAPVSSIAPESRCRAEEFGAEPRIECGSESAQRRGARATSVRDKAALVLPRCGDRLVELCVCSAGRSPCRTTIFEADVDTARSAALIALFSGSGWPARRRIEKYLGAEFDRCRGRHVVGRDDGDAANRARTSTPQ